MKSIKLILISLAFISLSACGDDDQPIIEEPKVYHTVDQMGRPAINTVFNFFGNSDVKNGFNEILPSEGKSKNSNHFKGILDALQTYIFLDPNSYENILGANNQTLAEILAADVLSCDLSKSPSSYGTLNGRTLDDDVIDITLTLAFSDQSSEGADNPVKDGVSTDNVDSNDRTHSNSFPYIASSHSN
ncbi:DUF4331 family protein [Ekhidna sp.]|uniref:DUF4331 family protein n=1 Tax=Ekhidna sp. TaxID=2608089 RepID=UPI003B505123